VPIAAGLLPPKLRVGNLGIERDFLDVRDVIDACLLILAGFQALPLRSVFNVASGQPRRVGDLLDVRLEPAPVGSTWRSIQLGSARRKYLERSATPQRCVDISVG
jgi:nucleoside-diphosphate-sugar epimerase